MRRGNNQLVLTCNMAHRDVSLENQESEYENERLVAKAQYISLEVAAQVSYSPVVANVWSLGTLLFMLLTGAPLLEFASPTSQEFKTVRAMGCCGVL
ncbi:hypothetical protein PsorP6_003374 [Peronosclerospora sorghi]|uniref:Uncharacterized protein n=1 Tax=Peronosclerospora sorghi TaxID=230839 RepID=A0ACC0VKJ7_9STRA|nr:hypothetical protein PsorP6_003374 [Peronosclerospora sorghi]